MKIGIIAAMGKELDLLLHIIDNVSTVTANGITFKLGRIAHHEIVAMQCGIGKVNAAIGTLTMIDSFHPAMIINTGVAGGTGMGAGILDVVVADRVAYHDTWCGPGTIEGQAADCPPTFECSIPDGLLDGLDVKRGLVASGDRFITSAEEVSRILSIWPDAVAVDMESAAIAHVCYVKSVPFVCLRVISDTPGAADNIAQYENFWSDAPLQTFATLSSLLQRL